MVGEGEIALFCTILVQRGAHAERDLRRELHGSQEAGDERVSSFDMEVECVLTTSLLIRL